MSTSLPPLFVFLTLVAAAVTACSGGQTPGAGASAPPVEDAGPGEAGPADADAGARDVASAPAATPKQAPPDPELARIAALPEAERVVYARERMPDLNDLRSGRTPVDFSRFVKAGPTLALFVPEELLANGAETKAGRCRRVVFAVEPDGLHAEVPTDGGEGRPTLARSGSFENLILDLQVTLSGPHTRTLGRDARGQQTEAMAAYGTAWSPAGVLLEIRDDAILYGATPVSVQAACTSFEERPCADAHGSVSACVRCTHLAARMTSHDPTHHFALAGAVRMRQGVAEGEALPACATCPADTLGAEIPRVNRALAGIVFNYVSEGADAWPAFFTKKQPCVNLARKRAVEAQEAQKAQ